MPTNSNAGFDVVVVGAGTSGANAAYQFASRGLSVAVVERRPALAAGAQWHNGILDWQFDRAHVGRSSGPERGRRVPRLHMFGPVGQVALRMDDPPTVAADMSMLGRRLRDLGTQSGVVIFDEVERVSPIVDNGGRVVAIDLSNGSRLEAALFVDASGRRGILRRKSPALQEWCPAVRADELCSASDFRFRVSDPAGASAFLDGLGAAPGETVSWVGVSGGFSTRSMTVSPDLKSVSALVGCLANGRYGTGPSMLSELRRSQPWIGEPINGGSGVIPLRRPYSRFTAPGLALVGDSACQVFPAHGSGIGIGLIAGRILAESLLDDSTSSDIGDEARLWRYQVNFEREFGEALTSYEGVRRMSTALGTEGVSAMIDAGLMTDALTRAGLNQRMAMPRPDELARMTTRLAKRPRLSSKLIPLLARTQIAGKLAHAFPSKPDIAALRRWDRRISRSLGRLPI